MELSDFYQKLQEAEPSKNVMVTGQKIGRDDEPDAPSSGMIKTGYGQSQSPVQRMMYLGGQERDNNENLQSVNTLLNRAKEHVYDAFGRDEGMDALVAKYGKDTSTLTIKLGRDQVDDSGQLVINGEAHKDFGARRIENETQLAKLKEEVSAAKPYFPGIELHEIKSANGEDVAIVTGADPKAFNAVLAAQDEQKRLMRERADLVEEKRELQAKMGLNMDMASIAGVKEQKTADTYALSPAAEKGPKTHDFA